MDDAMLKIMIIGAHPDDAEALFGGTALLYRKLGHEVMMVSMTNGDAGHFAMTRRSIAHRRRQEAAAAARVLDVKYLVMPTHDGELMPTLENRHRLIRLMRRFEPDIIFTHPAIDYHPDHRYTNQLVMDTAFMLAVPHIVPGSPVLRKEPAYFCFTKKPECGVINVGIPIDSVWKRKLLALHQHTSQMYEWLPWVHQMPDPIPGEELRRLVFLDRWRGRRDMAIAQAFRSRMKQALKSKNAKVRYVEAVCAAPVGRQLSHNTLTDFFPFKTWFLIK